MPYAIQAFSVRYRRFHGSQQSTVIKYLSPTIVAVPERRKEKTRLCFHFPVSVSRICSLLNSLLTTDCDQADYLSVSFHSAQKRKNQGMTRSHSCQKPPTHIILTTSHHILFASHCLNNQKPLPRSHKDKLA